MAKIEVQWTETHTIILEGDPEHAEELARNMLESGMCSMKYPDYPANTFSHATLDEIRIEGCPNKNICFDKTNPDNSIT